jgi:tRNA(Ile)-lysidine synthase TilS/MesJ
MLDLDKNQICSACQTSKNQKPKTVETKGSIELELKSVFESYEKTSSGNYDILIMFSGGKDSCYMVQRIKNEHPKLRILTCSIDNNFMSRVAKENILKALAKLNVDHIFIKPKFEFNLKLFRYALTHLNKDGCYGTVDFSDGEFMLDSAKKLAQEKMIPLIACGYSKYQVQNGLNLFSFESLATTEKPERKSVAGLVLKDIFSVSELNMWWNSSNAVSEFLPRLIFPLYAWDLEEEEIKKQVVSWGLISKKNQSPIVTNHQLIPLLGVVDVHKFGYSSFESEFCRMIREGKAERQHWQYTFEFLEYTAKTGFLVKPVILDLLKELNLTLEDVGIHFEN